MAYNSKNFYRVFLKTRYTNNYSTGDLEQLALCVMKSDFDFSQVDFDRSTQVSILGRFLSEREMEIDRQQLSNPYVSFNIISFVESNLNPPSEKDDSGKWPFLLKNEKALLLKYLLGLKNGTSDTTLLSQVLRTNLDLEMIPQRFFNMNTVDLAESIRAYDRFFMPEEQLNLEN